MNRTKRKIEKFTFILGKIKIDSDYLFTYLFLNKQFIPLAYYKISVLFLF